MTLSKRELKPNPDVIFTVVDDKAILLKQDSGNYYSLNEVGTRMWVLLSELGSLDKVQAQLLAEFEVEEERLKQDLEQISAQLIENGLLI